MSIGLLSNFGAIRHRLCGCGACRHCVIVSLFAAPVRMRQITPDFADPCKAIILRCQTLVWKEVKIEQNNTYPLTSACESHTWQPERLAAGSQCSESQWLEPLKRSLGVIVLCIENEGSVNCHTSSADSCNGYIKWKWILAVILWNVTAERHTASFIHHVH